MSDEDFDDDDDEILARLRAAEERVKNMPPRCLDGFKVTPSTLKNHRFDGHGEPLNKVYQVACLCGGDQFRVLGHPMQNGKHYVFVSPLALACEACKKVTELFDTEIHGYDGELGHGSATLHGGHAERKPFACPHCRGEVMIVHTRFEHSGETLEDSTGEFEGNEHNLFTWFSLVGVCKGCGKTIDVTEFECA